MVIVLVHDASLVIIPGGNHCLVLFVLGTRERLFILLILVFNSASNFYGILQADSSAPSPVADTMQELHLVVVISHELMDCFV